MKKKYFSLGILGLSLFLTLVACKPSESTTDDKENNKIDTTEYVFSDDYDYYDEEVSTFKIELENVGVGSFIQEGNVYMIKSGGEYNLSGLLNDGYIVVDSSDTENDVIINLCGCTITSKENSPIFVKNSGSDVSIVAKKDTENLIIDRRDSVDSEDETQGSSAIYSSSDLELKGKGTLNVIGAVNNGIHSKDDLKIKNQNLNVKAVNNAVKGNDSVTIENLTATIISIGADGIKTTNSDISSKNNQRGNVIIKGSSAIDIYACSDGIDAAYNTVIEEGDDLSSPTINIYTNTYSEYSVEGASNLASTSTLYLRLLSSNYNQSYYHYAYCYNVLDSGEKVGEFVKFNYKEMVQSGGRPGSGSAYYILNSNVDTSKYKNIQFYIFSSDNPSLDDYYAASTGQTINDTKDMFIISSVTSSTKKIGGDWSSYTSQSQSGMPGGMEEGNTDKTEYSTKGIKADNEININAGNINIKSYDDSLHANSNVILENGNTSTGNININGGNIEITSKDDGIHGEGTVSLNGGNINVLTAYEGIEGPTINFNGSNVYIYATDDGVNASGNGGVINVSDGFLFSSVGSGDTDAIDSNGTYNQTGGVVISVAGSSQGMASALDTDSSVNLKGGALLCLGNIEKTPTLTNMTSKTISSMTSGDYVFNKDSISYDFSIKTNVTFSQNLIKFYGSAGTYNITKGGSVVAAFTI